MKKQELQKIIGRNLHRIRTEQHITREALAEKAGISVTFYANLECGNKMMSLTTLRKLADVLCVSTDALLYEDHKDERAASIQRLLQDQPESVISFVEKISHLVIESNSFAVETGAQEEGKEISDECIV